ncbi:unnamed protein product [Didymodactylos carnosus]|uniref:Uncharacterized protein n=1 Tax=Didymodactylos carnosus TaxID=1234261 RepID=A0A814PY42_9BILA|nr:unnamed protein product [Didymodactylos carnosus]CAF1112103.1 unnamed protein product [Didymodactylos carnosus]CAF3784902.1 unnamed protein product [Didymodactylos carnosus]CAF3876373.1 unnamed protein product [Didymodactylos carnosus]
MFITLLLVILVILIILVLLFVSFIVYFQYVSQSCLRFCYLSKISSVTSIKFSLLEQNRQTYNPANSQCQCHPHYATIIEPRHDCFHRSETLFISFAGGALLVGGFTFTEWKSTFTKFDLRADTLFLTDPAQSFYLQDSTYSWQGLKYYRSLIQKYSILYKRVILIGASMGASMVCMCSDLATLSIAFNPILDPSLAPSWFYYRTLQRYPKTVILEQVQTNIDKIMSENQHSILHVHWSEKSPRDIVQSKLISNQNVIFFTDADKCNKRNGVYFWLHNCNTHGLPQHLKRRGILTQLLQHHLNALG